MIYLNNAATTLQKPPCVVQAVVEAINGQGSCGRGSHTSELSAARTIFHTREALARIFAFRHPERVVFTANATQALNAALWGLLNPGTMSSPPTGITTRCCGPSTPLQKNEG